ncbi:hypothetical protein SAMN06265784_101336 [Paraburkholderia susongensis]|uniref:Uncharacterized protein n=1 Tax=Paraburkholderia susongensis TaxID=1515439 RepID=A0A1X7I5C4_9BURK|nr:hypothetical protein SAMN06265784_101336 [Paraburkholderia susongensis]
MARHSSTMARRWSVRGAPIGVFMALLTIANLPTYHREFLTFPGSVAARGHAHVAHVRAIRGLLMTMSWHVGSREINR